MSLLDEAWSVNGVHLFLGERQIGDTFAMDAEDEARAKLAALAPAMARVLLACETRGPDRDGDESCPGCGWVESRWMDGTIRHQKGCEYGRLCDAIRELAKGASQ